MSIRVISPCDHIRCVGKSELRLRAGPRPTRRAQVDVVAQRRCDGKEYELRRASRHASQQTGADGRRAAGVPVLLLPPSTLYNLPHNIHASEKWVPRPELQRELRAKMQGGRVAVAGVKALHGTGGVGKTSLAAWLVHDPEVQLRFPDGVFWITIGSEADVAAKQHELQTALAAAAPDATTAAAVAALRRLIVLDDAWTEAHVQPFEGLVGGGTTLLLTTRNSDLAHDFAGDGVLAVEKMAEAEAIDMLGKHLGRDVRGDADALTLVKQCYCLPIIP